MVGEPRKTTQIFISYASEDALIATAFETAFSSLASDGNYPLEVIRDIHSFQQGRPLTGQIHENLENSDILFIIYTEQLKQSHSFTGLELGSFGRIIYEEKKNNQQTDRLSVSLFLDEPPAPEEGILGIKLDIDALDRSSPSSGSGVLDPGGGLRKFLFFLSNLMIERQFLLLNPGGVRGNEQTRLDLAKKSKQDFIQSYVLPKLEIALTVALSSVIARNFIEQKFFLLRWEPRASGQIERVYDDTTMSSPSPEIYKAIGIPDLKGKITWQKFRENLSRKYRSSSQFVLDAIQNAVASAFAEGPVDNNQIFLSPDKTLYRVIVTRYNVFFDGGRTMHVYLIPFLSGREQRSAELALTLLRLSTEFRSDFLDRDGRFSVSQFDFYSHDPQKHNQLAAEAFRQLQLNTAAAHNVGLDEPRNFEKFFGHDPEMKPAEISQMYADWEKAMEKIHDVFTYGEGNPDDFLQKWRAALENYVNYAELLNRRIGMHSAERLQRWFESGKLN